MKNHSVCFVLFPLQRKIDDFFKYPLFPICWRSVESLLVVDNWFCFQFAWAKNGRTNVGNICEHTHTHTHTHTCTHAHISSHTRTWTQTEAHDLSPFLQSINKQKLLLFKYRHRSTLSHMHTHTRTHAHTHAHTHTHTRLHTHTHTCTLSLSDHA